jgi:hypothetical protein
MRMLRSEGTALSMIRLRNERGNYARLAGQSLEASAARATDA